MSEIRGWSHQEMMSMPKRAFYRYYGYWYQDQLREEIQRKEDESKRKAEEAKTKPKQWKHL
jgi:hypothetical protein